MPLRQIDRAPISAALRVTCAWWPPDFVEMMRQAVPAESTAVHLVFTKGGRGRVGRSLRRGTAVLMVWEFDDAGLSTAPFVHQLATQGYGRRVIAVVSPERGARELAVLRRAEVRIVAREHASRIIQELAHASGPTRRAARVPRIPSERDLITLARGSRTAIVNGKTLAAALGLSYRTLCRYAVAHGWHAPSGLVDEVQRSETFPSPATKLPTWFIRENRPGHGREDD